MGKVLIAFDTNHIKEYVFGTNKLKEIRGASSLLDYLNRIVMKRESEAHDPSFDERCIIYANGGSGLFVVDEMVAYEVGKSVQKAFREDTNGKASVSYIVQELPPDAPNNIDELLKYPMKGTLELMRYRLRIEKDTPSEILALPSHPFMRQCSSCGVAYASPGEQQEEDEEDEDLEREPDEANELYCHNCQEKRSRDVKVKEGIWEYISDVNSGRRPTYDDEYLWWKLITELQGYKYDLRNRTKRPPDFNIFRNFKGTKEYLGLIYADGNGMGKAVEQYDTLKEIRDFAKRVDGAIYKAVAFAISQHLKIVEQIKPKEELIDAPKSPLFPFDILLLGGDDVMMVVPASVAMEVALTIAKKFHEFTDEEYTLSVGVVLAPIKYPFGLLQALVSSTLKAAKKEGKEAKNTGSSQDTHINFMTVTGSTSLDFSQVYKDLSEKNVPVSVNGHEQKASFYATLRPYNPQQLEILLDAIRDGRKKGLGRTKLHQVRQAVLKKNMTTSLNEARAVLVNWRPTQREFVMEHFLELAAIYQAAYRDESKPGTLFAHVPFPWFADGDSTYRTSLLDFVELYDFVAGEEESQ